MADDNQPVEVKLEPEQPELDLGQPPKEPAKPAPKPEGIDVLKAQLAEVEKRADLERKHREEVERIARQREQDLIQARHQAQQAQVEVTDSRYQTIVNTIDAFRRDTELAKRDYAIALSNGNFDQVAEAQSRLARSEAQIVQLENGKAALEQQAEQWKVQQEQQAQQPQQRQQTPSERFEGYVAQFSPKAQQYFRAHPEYATDERLNRRLLRAHGEAVDDEGLVPDTDAYYRFLDDRMAPATQPQQRVPGNHRGGPPPAPVSRQPIGGDSLSGTVTLSPAEREAARISGLSDVEYAKQMLTLQAAGEITRH